AASTGERALRPRMRMLSSSACCGGTRFVSIGVHWWLNRSVPSSNGQTQTIPFDLIERAESEDADRAQTEGNEENKGLCGLRLDYPGGRLRRGASGAERALRRRARRARPSNSKKIHNLRSLCFSPSPLPASPSCRSTSR